jgi:transglutaminase-like putative cysteine protease
MLISLTLCTLAESCLKNHEALCCWCVAQNTYSLSLMKLKIHHTTTYHYSQDVALQPHRMMLSPRGSHDLKVLSTSIQCSPEADIVWSQDIFGNLVATAVFSQPTRELIISSAAVVEQSAPSWPLFRIAPSAHSFPFNYTADDVIDMGALQSPAASRQEGVTDWARSFVRSSPTDTLSLLKDMNASLLGRVTYRIRDEEGTQTAAQTLLKASGSCRDIAELLIEGVRHLGFGARAVSGYLYDPNASSNDPGSTHAWAEIYLPDAGWIVFDPTQRRMGEANLIAVAVARSNRQIMPIVGAYTGAPADFKNMEVRVSVTAA